MKKNVKSILFIFLAFQLLLFYTTCKKDDVQSKTGTFTDARDNHAYKWVRIGDQVWMAENLAYKPSSGNYWAYNNDQNNIAIYGYLYDWKTACNVCPSGWHLPSEEEWTKLTVYLGGYETAGGKLKATTGWYNPNSGAVNSSGFSGLPGGCRTTDGSFGSAVMVGYWWSSMVGDTSLAWTRYLYSHTAFFSHTSLNKQYGFSVRCVRD